MSGGLALDDIDNDGSLEFYVAHGRDVKDRLFSFDGTNFVELVDNNGIRPREMDRAGYFIDLDADGWKDFVSVQDESVEIFLNDQTGQFKEATARSRLFHQRSTFSMAAADVDLDGDVDLFFSHWDGIFDSRIDILIANNGQSPTVYENIADNDNHYLAIDLVGKGANPDAIGARVTLESATRTQLQEVQLGTWYLSQGPSILHFGLGQDDTVTSIDIRWLGPGLPTTQVHNVAADQLLVIEQP